MLFLISFESMKNSKQVAFIATIYARFAFIELMKESKLVAAQSEDISSL
jgi:hypothetical protein